ncbi:MAG: A24 family peptidase [Candidatus Woesearchaeota archaeon]
MLYYVDIFLSIFGLIMLVLASIEDIKKREVPDLISYTFIIFPLLARLYASFIINNFNYFLLSLIPLGLSLGIGLLMYYTNQWGGGDVKVLLGIAGTIGTFPLFLTTPIAEKILVELNLPLKTNLFFYIFFIISILEGAILGLSYGIFLIIKNWEVSKKHFIEYLKRAKIENLVFLSMDTILLILAIFLQEIYYFVAFIAMIALHLLLPLVHTIENISIIELEPTKLTEGDWVVEDIYINKKKIYSKNQPGIELKQIEELIKYHRQGLIKKVKVKVGFPFVPAFLTGYITTFIIFLFL